MNDEGFLPQSKPNTGNSPVNALLFMVTQLINQINVATLVEVVSVNVEGRTAPVGYVDVKCLVTQVDGDGNIIPNDIIYNIPFFRLQGGARAIIIDPVVGDIGFCVFADRDLSIAKAEGKVNPPGSKRRFSLSDGLYVGGWNVNVAPTSYVVIDDEGLDLIGPDGINATTPTFTINGDLHVTGKVTGADTAEFTGNVTGQGVSLKTHVHSGVTSGGSNTGAPV